MGTLLESEEALRARALEVNLTEAEVDALIGNRVDSLARLAFAACQPGESPSDEQVNAIFGGAVVPNQGTYASIRRLIFEAQTLLSADLQNKVHKTDDQIKTKMAPAERENRIKDQKTRLEGIRFKGEEECSFQSYDTVLGMLEKDILLYLGPEKFATRRQELLQKKSAKEVAIDQSSLVIKDKAQDLLCSTTTELETVNAMKRRSLAFDIAQACSFHAINAYCADLFDYLHQPPPPGYSSVSLTQVLRADRAAFLWMSEQMTTLKRDPRGNLPLDAQLAKVLSQPSVSFHLLPLPTAKGSIEKPAAKPKTKPDRKRSRSPPRNTAADQNQKGKGKGKRGKRGRGPNVPKQLINKTLQTPEGERLCWPFNLEQGCRDAKPGEKCPRGLHVCSEPGCLKPHSMQSHR